MLIFDWEAVIDPRIDLCCLKLSWSLLLSNSNPTSNPTWTNLSKSGLELTLFSNVTRRRTPPKFTLQNWSIGLYIREVERIWIWTKIFLEPKIFWNLKYFGTQSFLGSIFFRGPNFFGYSYFFAAQIFFGPKFINEPAFFGQKMFWNLEILRPRIFWDSKLFWTLSFSGPKMFW